MDVETRGRKPKAFDNNKVVVLYGKGWSARKIANNSLPMLGDKASLFQVLRILKSKGFLADKGVKCCGKKFNNRLASLYANSSFSNVERARKLGCSVTLVRGRIRGWLNYSQANSRLCENRRKTFLGWLNKYFRG